MPIGSAFIKSLVALGDSLSKGVQATVIHERRTGVDKSNRPTYDPKPVPIKALIQQKTRLIVVSATETIEATGPITVLASYSVGMHDRLTLPDGRRGVVAFVDNGLLDPEDASGRGFLSRVWVGL